MPSLSGSSGQGWVLTQAPILTFKDLGQAQLLSPISWGLGAFAPGGRVGCEKELVWYRFLWQDHISSSRPPLKLAKGRSGGREWEPEPPIPAQSPELLAGRELWLELGAQVPASPLWRPSASLCGFLPPSFQSGWRSCKVRALD